MSFGIKRDVSFVSAGTKTSRLISKIDPITESVITEFGIPEWALRKNRLVVKTDSRIYACPELRLHRSTSPCLCWKAMDSFPFDLHLNFSSYEK